MDNVCHTLVGAAFGEAGLKSRTRLGLPILMVAANLPDVDVAAFLTDVPSVALRRGWTHGVLAQALLPVLFTAVVVALDRVRARASPAERVRPGGVLLLAYVGVLSHVALDWLNTYGVRLLMPFSGRWFYGDAVFIIDPWLWLALGLGVFAARRRATVVPARAALLVSVIYVAAMVLSAAAARQRVADAWTARHGSPPRALMVGPVPLDPLRKTVIVDAGDRYVRGSFSWTTGAAAFDGGAVEKGDGHPAVRRARETEEFRAVLVWARFPYYEAAPAPGGTRVGVRDVRFGTRVGAADVVVPAP